MATVIRKSTKGVKTTPVPRRRVARNVKSMQAPLERNEERGTEMPSKARLTRRALVPLKEAFFVGIGAVDWMLEQTMRIEKDLSERGHRRSEVLNRVASQMGTVVAEKSRTMSKRGRERMDEMSEKVGEGIQKARMRPAMPEIEP